MRTQDRGRAPRARPRDGGRGAAAPASAEWRPASAASAGDRAGPAPCRNRPGSPPARLRDCRRTAPASDRAPRMSSLAEAPLQAQRLCDLDDFRGERARPRVRAAAPPASSMSMRRRRHGRGSTSWPTARSIASGIDAGMAVERADPRRRPASADRADRRDRRRAAGATCRRRSESRAGSSRRAPEPAPTDRGCGRAPEAAVSARCHPRGSGDHYRRNQNQHPPAHPPLIVAPSPNSHFGDYRRACRSRCGRWSPARTCPRRQAPGS